MRSCFSGCLFVSVAAVFLGSASEIVANESQNISPSAVIHELNLARTNPASYAAFLEEMRLTYPGSLRTHEGVRALEEAIQFLLHATARPPLSLSAGMCQAAVDHCRDQSGGTIGHSGSDGTDPGRRISRYGAWSQCWAENIAYGQRSARAIVMALIIDDGVPGRGHRKNIFDGNFNVAGAAYGSHARFGTVCSIDFAGNYAERAIARDDHPRAETF